MGYSPSYFDENRSKNNIDLNVPTERAPFKLSENQKIIEIGSLELKLWPFEKF